MRRAAALMVLLGVGFLAQHALAALPSQLLPTTSVSLPTTTVSVPTLPVSTTVPTILTTTVPKLPTTTTVSTTLPKLPTTTTVSTIVTTTVSTTVPKLPTTTVSTTVPLTTSTSSVSTTSVPSAPSLLSGTSSTSAPSSSSTLAGSTAGTATSALSGSGSPAPINLFAFGASSAGGGSAQSYPGASPAGSTSSYRAAANAPRVNRLHSSRTWIGTSGKRATTLTFVLSKRGKVIFTVDQVSPTCTTIARFAVRGHKGLNRIRFAARVGREKLSAGTYRITAHTPAGHPVQRVIVVVIAGGAPTRDELAALRTANVCPATREFAGTAFGSTILFDMGVIFDPNGSARVSFSPQEEQPSASGATEPETGGVLGATPVEEAARALRPALIALLAAAIVLLGLASLPRVAASDGRLNDVLARHRVEIAGVGAAALMGVVIAFLLA